MFGLSDTFDRLAESQRWLLDLASGTVGSGVLEEISGFGDNPGALRMFAHRPPALAPRAPLVVVLHGCAQSADDHAVQSGWVALAARESFVLLAPEQGAMNNLNRCFSWYEPGESDPGGREVASIRQMIGHALATWDLDPEQVFITGLSAGGAMALTMLARHPDVFAGGGVVAGMPHGVADGLGEALQAMRDPAWRTSADLAGRVRDPRLAHRHLPRLSIWQGSADRTVKPSNADDIARQWAAAQGLPDRPDETRTRKGWRRAAWHSATTGEPAIELNVLKGLAHGAPLAAGGADGLGEAGPWMLEAGVSSTLEIARFWGISRA